MSRRRSGMLLLEVMLGTVLLGIAGVALIIMLQQTVETVRFGRETELRTALAVEALNRAQLWSSAELEAHVGRARLGTWNIEVSMPASQLYTVTVRDTLTDAEVLHTTVYRKRQVINER